MSSTALKLSAVLVQTPEANRIFVTGGSQIEYYKRCYEVKSEDGTVYKPVLRANTQYARDFHSMCYLTPDVLVLSERHFIGCLKAGFIQDPAVLRQKAVSMACKSVSTSPLAESLFSSAMPSKSFGTDFSCEVKPVSPPTQLLSWE